MPISEDHERMGCEADPSATQRFDSVGILGASRLFAKGDLCIALDSDPV
jgi:hypothetical protein